MYCVAVPAISLDFGVLCRYCFSCVEDLKSDILDPTVNVSMNTVIASSWPDGAFTLHPCESGETYVGILVSGPVGRISTFGKPWPSRPHCQTSPCSAATSQRILNRACWSSRTQFYQRPLVAKMKSDL